MATSDAPISVASVTLVVNDLIKISEFYRSVVGLNEISKDANTCTLGQGNVALLTLVEDKKARSYPREAGLFHTAFLLPNRAALGSWYKFSKEIGIRLDGVADHGVSEALYLSDPEGNGIEIYADRDRSAWHVKDNGEVRPKTSPLRSANLLKAANDDWNGAPDNTVIGHVHLQVGELNAADAFYVNTLGLDRTSKMESASFYGSGGYHHHLAGNIWNSQGASIRSSDSTGLQEVELRVSDPSYDLKNAEDPWGIHFRITKVA